MSGGGAYVNDVRLRIPEARGSQTGLVGIGHSTRVDPDLTLSALNHLFSFGGMFHRCGSGALSLAWVAAGRLIAYYEPHMNAWDCLAGLLLVREAGGWTNDFLCGEALETGNLAAAAAPGMIDQIKIIGGLAQPAEHRPMGLLAES
jgi:myo-inositol-1(or 4)-monophosphatase